MRVSKNGEYTKLDFSGDLLITGNKYAIFFEEDVTNIELCNINCVSTKHLSLWKRIKTCWMILRIVWNSKFILSE